MEEIRTIVSIILMLVVTVDLTVAYLLIRGAVRSNYSILALNERAFVALSQAASGIMLGILGANRIFGWQFNDLTVLVILSIALIIQATPGFVWLALFLSHKFRSNDDGAANPVTGE